MAHYLEKKVYINEEILDKLETEAVKNRISLTTLLNHIFRKYIENNTDAGPNEEKRRFPRKKVVIPAIIYGKNRNGGGEEDVDMGMYLSSTIFDISLGGLGLLMSVENDEKMELLKNNSEFEVISYLSGSQTLFRFNCWSEHVEKDDSTVKVGSSFINGDPAQLHELESCLANM